VAPVKDASGKVIAVLAGSSYLDSLSARLEKLQFGDTGEAVMLNQNGYFITGSRFTEQL
jgi:hypothetical protein